MFCSRFMTYMNYSSFVNNLCTSNLGYQYFARGPIESFRPSLF
ncbi:Protein of unknown function [Pyronema omphalodes CBS 100304]|uniref:Uncharacterized protein n=1 Tax=Pyronema omphalodes (strain CBS 100304) TaxID=1076935 RepID=U4LCH6_PYROM|nr:Protein of unknown function [Pyronema omphalodes CBS 100304]